MRVPLAAVAAGVLRLVDALVTEPLQILFERLGAEGQTDVQLGGLGIHLRGQCPAAPLELTGDLAVQREHPDGERDRRDAKSEGDAGTESACDIFSVLSSRIRVIHCRITATSLRQDSGKVMASTASPASLPPGMGILPARGRSRRATHATLPSPFAPKPRRPQVPDESCMNHEIPLVLNVAVALGIAVAGGFLASWLRQSPIFGYLLAGVAIGPFTPGFVGNREQIALLADVGVIFLMFGLGVAFSLKDLARVRAIATIGTSVQVVLTILGGTLAGMVMGWGCTGRHRVRRRARGQQLHGDFENIAGPR